LVGETGTPEINTSTINIHFMLATSITSHCKTVVSMANISEHGSQTPLGDRTVNTQTITGESSEIMKIFKFHY
jgi:hypothetical protein